MGKFRNLIFIPLGLFLIVSGCSPIGGGDLTVKITGGQFLIDTSQTSCKGYLEGTHGDVPAISFTINKISVTNPKASELDLVYIKINIRSGYLTQDYEKVISGDDLIAAWNNGGGTAAAIPAGEIGSNNCTFKIGGISLVDKTRKAYGFGTIYVYATYDDSGTTKATNGTTTFNWEY